MPFAHRSLIEATAACFGWRRAYGDITTVDSLLNEQTDAAYTEATRHVQAATAKNSTALHLQPGVLDVRGRVLSDVLYLEGVLTGARKRNLAPELIERLEETVDKGHELARLLADTVHTTTARPKADV